MRILIATPLYPPEVADAAAYAKELARRLAKDHEITVVAYAHLPEELPEVRVVTIEKRQPRFARLRQFRETLAREERGIDAVIAVNGASVELPLILSAKIPLIFCAADRAAYARGGLLQRHSFARALMVIRDIPPCKPEILPLEPEPTEALTAWEHAWEAHLARLDSLFTHAKR